MEVGRLQSSISSHRMESNFDYIFFYLNWGRVMGISSIAYFTRKVYDSYQRNIDDDDYSVYQPRLRSNSMRSNTSYSSRSQGENDNLSRGSSVSGSATRTPRRYSTFGTRSARGAVSGFGGKKRRKTIKKKKKQ